LRRGDDIETITSERAAELLAEKRAKGPTPKKRPARRRQATAAATNSSSKQAAKKATAKTVRAKAG
jgi:DNA topoisomerase-1